MNKQEPCRTITMITITGVHLQSEPVLFQIFWCKPARCHVQCVVWDVVKHGDTLAILWEKCKFVIECWFYIIMGERLATLLTTQLNF